MKKHGVTYEEKEGVNLTGFCKIGGNHILLVEGNKDIKFFREVLSKYGLSDSFIIIDIGGNISENTFEKILEIKRINPKSLNLIIDSDRIEENQELKPSLNKFLKYCNENGINAIATEFNATENYINQLSLDMVYSVGKFIALNPYELFKDLSSEMKWSKCDNWRMARVMEKSDFDKTDLGVFFNRLKLKIVGN